MIVFKSPQVNDQERICYQVMGDIIEAKAFKLVGKIENDEEIIVEELVSTTYFDLSNIEQDKLYAPQYPINSASKEGDILRVELLNYIGSDATEEERFPEWITLEETEFDIPDDIEFIELEEIIVENEYPPQDLPNYVTELENKNRDLEAKIEQIKKQNQADRMNNEMMIGELLDMMSSLL